MLTTNDAIEHDTIPKKQLNVSLLLSCLPKYTFTTQIKKGAFRKRAFDEKLLK